jgi:hypothetical protein
MQASQTTQVQSSLSRIVVTPTVVLVQIARRLHDQIRSGDEAASGVEDLDLRFDLDLSDLVEDAQQRLPRRLRTPVAELERSAESARSWTSREGQRAELIDLDVATSQRRVHEDDQIEDGEVAARSSTSAGWSTGMP